MARKFAVGSSRFFSNPDRCEEILIIQTYNEIRKFIAPDRQWKDDVETQFYERGNAVGFHHINFINQERARKQLTHSCCSKLISAPTGVNMPKRSGPTAVANCGTGSAR